VSSSGPPAISNLMPTRHCAARWICSNNARSMAIRKGFAAIEEDLRARMAVPVESPNRILLHACCPDNPGDGRESQSRDEDRHLQPRHWPNVTHSTSIVGLGRTSIGPKVLASRRRLLGHFVTLRDGRACGEAIGLHDARCPHSSAGHESNSRDEHRCFQPCHQPIVMHGAASIVGLCQTSIGTKS